MRKKILQMRIFPQTKKLTIQDIGVLVQYAITKNVEDAITLFDKILVFKAVKEKDFNFLSGLGLEMRSVNHIERELYPELEMVEEVAKTLDLDFLIKCGRQAVADMLRSVVFSWAMDETSMNLGQLPNHTLRFNLNDIRKYNKQNPAVNLQTNERKYPEETITKETDLLIKYAFNTSLPIVILLVEELFLAKYRELSTPNELISIYLGLDSDEIKTIGNKLKEKDDTRADYYRRIDLDFLLDLGLRKTINELRKRVSAQFFESVIKVEKPAVYDDDQIPNSEDLRIPALYGLTCGIDEARKVLTGGLIRAARQECDSLDDVARLLGIGRDQVLTYYKIEYYEDRKDLQTTGFEGLIEYGLSEGDLKKAKQLLEKEIIRLVLDSINNTTEGAVFLGVNGKWLFEQVNKYGFKELLKKNNSPWPDNDKPRILEEIEPFIFLGMKARLNVIGWLKAELVDAAVRQHGSDEALSLLKISQKEMARIRTSRPKLNNAPNIEATSILLQYALEHGLNKAIEGFDKDLIRRAIDEAAGNKKSAASMMGIANPTIYKLTKKYGLR
ncbi:hypothetical protein ACFL4D_01410 [Candidatus Margulisiibacteriota bacterium]